MKKGQAKPDIVTFSLRLPRAISVRIRQLAAHKNLSMQQAIQEAIVHYCRNESAKGDK
jgi:predicted transcriptional regulator